MPDLLLDQACDFARRHAPNHFADDLAAALRSNVEQGFMTVEQYESGEFAFALTPAGAIRAAQRRLERS